MTEFPMSAQCSRRASSSSRSSEEAKMLSQGASGTPKLAKDWADVALFTLEATARLLVAAAIFLVLNSLKTST
jgi:hypothetical protein